MCRCARSSGRSGRPHQGVSNQSTATKSTGGRRGRSSRAESLWMLTVERHDGHVREQPRGRRWAASTIPGVGQHRQHQGREQAPLGEHLTEGVRDQQHRPALERHDVEEQGGHAGSGPRSSGPAIAGPPADGPAVRGCVMGRSGRSAAFSRRVRRPVPSRSPSPSAPPLRRRNRRNVVADRAEQHRALQVETDRADEDLRPSAPARRWTGRL